MVLCEDCPYFDEVERHCVRNDGRCIEDDISDMQQEENDARYVESVIEQEEEGEKMKYTMEITETLSRRVTIESNSLEEANRKAEELYHRGDIVLTGDDFQEYNITGEMQEKE